MTVTIESFRKGQIPAKNAFCQPDVASHTKDGGNFSPAVEWSGAPAETKSFAIIMHDPDVPTSFENANQEGKVIPASMPRQPFYHWVLVDIPATLSRLNEGEDSDRVMISGKPAGLTPHGLRGLNDFGKFKQGTFGGYDGPCPPWNDELLHRYVITVFALDVPSLGLTGSFDGPMALTAMKGHVVGEGRAMGTYSQNLQVLRQNMHKK